MVQIQLEFAAAFKVINSKTLPLRLNSNSTKSRKFKIVLSVTCWDMLLQGRHGLINMRNGVFN